MTSVIATGTQLVHVSPCHMPRCSWPCQGPILLGPAIDRTAGRPVSFSKAIIRVPSPLQSFRRAPDVKTTSPRMTSPCMTSPRMTSPRGIDVAHTPQHTERTKCDCHCLIDNFKNQLEQRFACLEAQLRNKLWDLEGIRSKVSCIESTMQSQTSGYMNDMSTASSMDAPPQNKLLALDTFGSRFFSFEANAPTTSPMYPQNYTSNSKANMDNTLRAVEEIHTQMATMTSEFNENSKILFETQAQISNLESDFKISTRTIKWMECKVFDLSSRLHEIGCLLEKAQEKHEMTRQECARDLASVGNSCQGAPCAQDADDSIGLPDLASSCAKSARSYNSPFYFGQLFAAARVIESPDEVQEASSLEALHGEVGGRIIIKNLLECNSMTEDACLPQGTSSCGDIYLASMHIKSTVQS